MLPIVSIIIPIYNSELSLVQCLDSVREQNYHDIEVLMINDGSTDCSGEICDQYVRMDHRFIVTHTSNKGVSSARNKGLEMATGKYIMFVDSDDYIDVDMLDDMVVQMEYSNADLCVRAMEYQEEDREDYEVLLTKEHVEWILFLHRNYLVYGPTSKLYKREIIKSNSIFFPTGVSYGEDLVFNMTYLQKSSKLAYLHKAKYHYIMRNSQSLSQKTRWDMFDNDYMLFKTLYQWFANLELLTDQVFQFLYERLFDTAYNSVCLIFKKECHWSLGKKHAYLKRILQNTEVKNSFPYVEEGKYSHKLVECMKNEKYWMLIGKSLIPGEGNA